MEDRRLGLDHCQKDVIGLYSSLRWSQTALDTTGHLSICAKVHHKRLQPLSQPVAARSISAAGMFHSSLLIDHLPVHRFVRIQSCSWLRGCVFVSLLVVNSDMILNCRASAWKLSRSKRCWQRILQRQATHTVSQSHLQSRKGWPNQEAAGDRHSGVCTNVN